MTFIVWRHIIGSWGEEGRGSLSKIGILKRNAAPDPGLVGDGRGAWGRGGLNPLCYYVI